MTAILPNGRGMCAREWIGDARSPRKKLVSVWNF